MEFDVGVFTGISGSVVALGGLGITLWRTRNDKRAGIRSNELETRRDTISDRDALIDQFQEIIKTEREERVRQEKVTEIRLNQLEMALQEEREYNRALVEHIWTKKPPPPPKRMSMTAQPSI